MIRSIIIPVCCWSLATLAQPVLQFENMPASPTLLDWYMVTDFGTAVPPSDGEAQVWDFTSVTLELMGTATMRDAVGTPYAAVYPDANWVLQYYHNASGAIFYTYSRVLTTGVEAVANEVPVSTTEYTDYKRIMQFPFAYGNTFTDAYQEVGGAMQSVTRSYTGYGTAQTPVGDLAGLAKISSSEGGIELYNSTPFYPAILINSDGSVFVFTPSNSGVREDAVSARLTVYPSATSDELNVSVPQGAQNAEWSITDPSGRLVLSGTLPMQGTVSLHVGTLAPGPYHLSMQGRNQRWTAAFQRVP